MLLLILFSFIAGIVTILSPCILPILPIILSSSVTGGKQKPLGIVSGFIASFTFFTLFLSSLVQAFGISADLLRNFSIVIIFFFGLSLTIPAVQLWIEVLFSKLSSKLSSSNAQQKEGFFGGVLVGLSLGLLWTPCVGPILASVISLALTGTVTTTAFFITLAYSVGTAIPMLLITYSGRSLFQKIPGLLSHTAKIQQVFGAVMIVTAIGLFFNIDRKFQTYILQTFPSYGAGLTQFEDNEHIQNQLDRLRSDQDSGSRLFENLTDSENSPEAPELILGGQWFNTPNDKALQLSEVRGKVVLVDFWTYSCINCIRTLPYLKAWHEKYEDDGLIIIGVHAPEFEFEKSAGNVQKAINDFEITYPVMQDNDFKTWRAYQNKYWPAKYLIDKDGKVRYTHFGEGKYEQTEQIIQELLKESGSEVSAELTPQTYSVTSRTPELYLGYNRMEYLSSPERIQDDIFSEYTSPEIIPDNTFSFTGKWKVTSEFSHPQKNAELQVKFESKDVFLVMNPTDETPSKILVELDGQMVTTGKSGRDVKNGIVEVTEDRLYHLIQLPEPGVHTLRLLYADGNVEVFAFTFG